MISVLKKKLNKKNGFTLAELLVVVAIVAILVAIAIPVFSASTARAEEAVVKANLRAVYAEAVVEYLDKRSVSDDNQTVTIEGVTYKVTLSAEDANKGEPTLVSATGMKGSLEGKTCTYDGKAFTGPS